MIPVANAPEFTYLYGGSSLTSLDYFALVLIGFFIFYFVFLFSGVAFLLERTGGTRRHKIVFGYILGFGLFTVLRLTHAAAVLHGEMIRGQSLDDHDMSLWGLLGYCMLFLTLNVLVLKRYRNGMTKKRRTRDGHRRFLLFDKPVDVSEFEEVDDLPQDEGGDRHDE
jgi:hypothetical protein